MAVYRHFQSVRTALYALFAGLALLGGLPHGAYAADDLFTVENVEVDVTADNAVEARNKALDEAQVKAYRMLAEKFYTPEQFGGGKTVAAPVLEKALVMFDGFKPASDLHPVWGKSSTQYFLSQCK